MCKHTRSLIVLVFSMLLTTPSEARAEVRDKIWTQDDLTCFLLAGLLLGLLIAAVAARWPVPVLLLPGLGLLLGAMFIAEMFFSDISHAIESEMGPAYLRLGWAVGLTWTFGFGLAWLYGVRCSRRRTARDR